MNTTQIREVNDDELMRSLSDMEIDAVSGGRAHPIYQECGPLLNAWEGWIADYFGICVR
jgi:hypothetical protein